MLETSILQEISFTALHWKSQQVKPNWVKEVELLSSEISFMSNATQVCVTFILFSSLRTSS